MRIKFVLLLAAIVSILLSIYVGYSGPSTYDFAANWLMKKGVSMGQWELFHSVLGLSIGTVPFFCALIWLMGKRTNLFALISYPIFCWGVTFLIIVLVFNSLPTDLSSLYYTKRIILPSELFWNYALILASFTGPIVLFIRDLLHRKEIIARLCEQEKSLDHRI